MLFDTSKKKLSRGIIYTIREKPRGARFSANVNELQWLRMNAKNAEYNTVFEMMKAIIFLLHTQFTTCITVRNAMNLLPHLSKPFFRETSANCSI